MTCLNCKHFYQNTQSGCAAYPNGIPLPINSGQFDHSNPFAGDNGIRYEAIEGVHNESDKYFGEGTTRISDPKPVTIRPHEILESMEHKEHNTIINDPKIAVRPVPSNVDDPTHALRPSPYPSSEIGDKVIPAGDNVTDKDMREGTAEQRADFRIKQQLGEEHREDTHKGIPERPLDPRVEPAIKQFELFPEQTTPKR